MTREILLQAEGVGKHFGGLKALTSVDFTIQRGEIYGLIGPNGAGKTTLFNVLTGLYTADEGSFMFDGRDLRGLKPYQVARRGFARTFQNIRLFSGMTALENVMVGRHLRSRTGIWGGMLRTPAARAEELFVEAKALSLLGYVGIAHRANEPAGALPYGDQRRLEIARALATEPRLLALDEPAAGMNATETLALRKLVETIRGDGVTVLLIEHDMKLVMGLCDRVLVLEYGKVIAEGVPAEVKRNPKVIEAYLGAGAADPEPSPEGRTA